MMMQKVEHRVESTFSPRSGEREKRAQKQQQQQQQQQQQASSTMMQHKPRTEAKGPTAASNNDKGKRLPSRGKGDMR